MIDLWLISDVFRKFRIFTVFEGSLDTSDIFLTNFGNSDLMLKKKTTPPLKEVWSVLIAW